MNSNALPVCDSKSVDEEIPPRSPIQINKTLNTLNESQISNT